MNNEETHPVIFPGMVVAGVEIKSSLNAKRIRVLSRRRNGLFGNFPERGGLAGIESLFFCLSLSSDELATSYGWTLEGWDEAVEKFAINLPDGGIEEFAALFKDEEAAIIAAGVKPEGEDEGKDTGAVVDTRNRPLTRPSLHQALQQD